ncbi:hypothetical protein GJ496_002646 [Pomphorhynchus laevis]|nr:hypothetical protein GJ496_002646 [Pomphorhynchus laevis]
MYQGGIGIMDALFTCEMEYDLSQRICSTYRLEVGGDSLRQHQLVICILIAISKKKAFTARLIKAKESLNKNIVQCLNYRVAKFLSIGQRISGQFGHDLCLGACKLTSKIRLQSGNKHSISSFV